VSKANIICVGDELLHGAIADRDGAMVASFLRRSGIVATRIVMVGDDYRAIAAELAAASARCDLLVVTGGLGPTSDDQTRDALGFFVGQAVEFDEELWMEIQRTLGRKLRGSNRSQACRPALFSPLLNARGTAPGLIGEVGGCRVVALPGPPGELQGMLDNHGETIVAGLGEYVRIDSVFSVFGVPESRLEDAMRDISRESDSDRVEWHTRAEPYRIVLRLAGGTEESRAERSAELARRIGPQRLAADETTIAAVVIDELRVRGLRLAAAESCTGGMIGSLLTSVPGASDVFWGSCVTYANDAKDRVLDVRSVAEHGAVSEETVREMVGGVLRLAGVSAGIAVSGIAGPDGGTDEKPVGTVWIACALEGKVAAERFQLPGDRDRIRRSATVEALVMLRVMIGGIV